MGNRLALNRRGFCIVAQEALDCFLRTKMDVLVLGNWMVKRGAN